MMILMALLALLAAAGIAVTVREVLRDGLRRIPTRRGGGFSRDVGRGAYDPAT